MKYIFLLFCSMFFLSCVSRKKEVINKSTIKLEGKKTSISDLIDIDGYYTSDPENMKYGGYIFFEDGSWAYFFKKSELTQFDLQTSLDQSIKKEKSGKWGDWGVYTIQNDTIVVYSYDEPLRLAPWGLSEQRYKVIDRQTLQYVFYKSKIEDHEYNERHNNPWIDNPHYLYFIPADSLPSSDNWLKEKKWIWRNESDWNKYMQYIKDEKKKTKK